MTAKQRRRNVPEAHTDSEYSTSEDSPDDDEPAVKKVSKKAKSKTAAKTSKTAASQMERPELQQSKSSSAEEADHPQNLHCFKCNFPLSLREEIVPHRSGCAVSGAFPETSFTNTRTGMDSYVECLFCHAVADKAHWSEFLTHMHQHSEVWADSNVAVFNLSRSQYETISKTDNTAKQLPSYPTSVTSACDNAPSSQQSDSETNAQPDPADFRCGFCINISYKSHRSLKKHFKTFHEVREKPVLNALQKVHLFVRKIETGKTKRGKAYLCLAEHCFALHDRKRRHWEVKRHHRLFQKIRSLKDLPDEVMSKVHIPPPAPKDALNPFLKKPFNFEAMLIEYKARKIRESENNQSHTVGKHNVQLYINRFVDAIIATHGFTKPIHLGNWVTSYPRVLAPGSRKNWLHELKEFVQATFINFTGV